jgi:hypothetical protein
MSSLFVAKAVAIDIGVYTVAVQKIRSNVFNPVFGVTRCQIYQHILGKILTQFLYLNSIYYQHLSSIL